MNQINLTAATQRSPGQTKASSAVSAPDAVGERVKYTKEVRATLLFALLAAAFLWRWTLLGEAFVSGDILLQFYPWKARPGGQRESYSPHNPLLSDQIFMFYPWSEFARRSLLAGQNPLWNPHSSSGAPFAANYQSAVYFPLQVLVYLGGTQVGLGLLAFAKLLLSSLGTYLFLRAWKLREPASLVGAILASYHLFNVVWLGYSMTHVTIWLPWMMLAVQRLAEAPSLRRVAFVSLVTGLHLSGGQPQSSLHLILVSAVYLGFLLLWPANKTKTLGLASPVTTLRAATAFVLACCLGAGLLAVQILPFQEYAARSVTLELRQNMSDAVYGHRTASLGETLGRIFSWGGTGLPLESSVSLLMPRYFGDPTTPDTEWGFWNFSERTFYVGVVTLLLAGVGLMQSAQRFLKRTACGLLVLCLGLIFGLPVLKGIALLPSLDLAINTRLIFVASWCLALLAALGVEGLLDSARVRSRQMIYYLSAWFAGALLLGGGLWLTLSNVTSNGFIERSSRAAFQFFEIQQIATFLLIILLAVVLLAWRHVSKRGGNLSLLLLVLLAVADQFYYGVGFNSYVKPPVAPVTPLIGFLQSHAQGDRFLALGDVLPPNAGTLLGLNDARGYDGMELADYFRFKKGPDASPDLDFFFLSRPGEIRRDWVLNLLSIKYLATPPDLELAEEDGRKWLPDGIEVRQVYGGQDGRVYENLKALPRAFVVHRAEFFPDKDSVLAAMQRKDWDYRQSVLLVGENAAFGAPTGIAPGADQVRSVSYQPDEIVLDVESALDGYLVLGEVFYPGWKGWVDGQSADILRADYVLRAVRLAAGRHRVRLAYEPARFYSGLAVSVLSMLLVALLLLIPGPRSPIPE